MTSTWGSLMSRQVDIAQRLIKGIAEAATTPMRIMEVCGTHTVAIFRAGIRSLMPQGVELISGPGCPVCVTPIAEIDQAIILSGREGVILATFGDLMRVPGTKSSLQQEKGRGCAVQVVLSPLEAVKLAEANPERAVVFHAVGFETTAPAIAAAVKEAKRRRLANFYLLSSLRLIPPPLRALLASKEVKIDGLILPGHVSVIIGSRPYRFIAEEFGIPGVITGFEPVDILEGISMLFRQKKEGRAAIEIQYRRAVKEEGNSRACALMAEVFEVCDAYWRGLGEIPDSGLRLRDGFSHMDAKDVFNLPLSDGVEPQGCRCGEVLQGRIAPTDCPMFGTRCKPEAPLGACMVSSEGSCAAYYRYGGRG